MPINDDVGVLTVEHALELFVNGLEVDFRGGQFTEGVVLVGAPEETALGEASLSVTVSADSDVVITLKTCNRLVKTIQKTYR